MTLDDRTPNHDAIAICNAASDWRERNRHLSHMHDAAWVTMGAAIDNMHQAALAPDSKEFAAALLVYRGAFAIFTAARMGRLPEHPLRPTLTSIRAPKVIPWTHDAILFMLAVAEEERAISPYNFMPRTIKRLLKTPELAAFHSLAMPLTSSRVSGALRRFRQT